MTGCPAARRRRGSHKTAGRARRLERPGGTSCSIACEQNEMDLLVSLASRPWRDLNHCRSWSIKEMRAIGAFKARLTRRVMRSKFSSGGVSKMSRDWSAIRRASSSFMASNIIGDLRSQFIRPRASAGSIRLCSIWKRAAYDAIFPVKGAWSDVSSSRSLAAPPPRGSSAPVQLTPSYDRRSRLCRPPPIHRGRGGATASEVARKRATAASASMSGSIVSSSARA